MLFIILLEQFLSGLQDRVKHSKTQSLRKDFGFNWVSRHSRRRADMLHECTGRKQESSITKEAVILKAEFYVNYLLKAKLWARKLSPAARFLLCSRKWGFNMQFTADCTEEILNSIIISSSWEKQGLSAWILHRCLGQKGGSILFQNWRLFIGSW